MHYRIFNSDSAAWKIKHLLKEASAIVHLEAPVLIAVQPANTRVAEVGASRVTYQQIKSRPIIFHAVVLDMGTRRVRGQQITGDGIVAISYEGIPDRSAALAQYGNLTQRNPFRSEYERR